MFPWLLENEESQVKDGIRFYPRLLRWFGMQINLVESDKEESNMVEEEEEEEEINVVESYKEESNFLPISVPIGILLTGIFFRLSY